MAWKCVCKEENSDESQNCKNCARKKPKYMGIKIDLGAIEKMDDKQMGVWYLMIAFDHLSDARGNVDLHGQLSKTTGEARSEAISRMAESSQQVVENCKRCLAVLEKASKLDPSAQFEEPNGAVQNVSTIKSDCYFQLGSLNFQKGNFAEAITYYQKSYDADPNQVSIYNIALATINLPVEGGGLFGGKKKQAAGAKKEQEIELLKKTIKFSPFSEVGIKSGRMLLEDYEMTDITDSENTDDEEEFDVCYHCGAELSEKTKQCPECGKAL